jgi:hypothetical protein
VALDPLHAVMGSPRMSVPSLAHSEHACTTCKIIPLLHTKVIWPYSQLLRQGMRSCTPGFLNFRPDNSDLLQPLFILLQQHSLCTLLLICRC